MPWEDVFDTVEPAPMAAETIGQVHRARLSSGDRVVVKVQRPETEDLTSRGLSLLAAFAERLVAHARIAQLLDVQAIVDQLVATIFEELDFGHEARNLERMRQVLSPYSHLGVPRLYPELSSRRLLVMDDDIGRDTTICGSKEAVLARSRA